MLFAFKKSTWLSIATCLGVIVPISNGGEIPIVSGAQPKLLETGFKFTEGPVADSAGNVYFTDQPNDRIMKWTVGDNSFSTFMQPAGRANGLEFDGKDHLIACADEKGQLLSINVNTKAVEVLLDRFQGKLFNGPNDVWIRKDGSMFFTDPFYKRDYWQDRDQPEQAAQRVYYLAKGAKEPVIAEETLVQPNGIVGSPDGATLFVADIGAQKTYRYRIAPDGKLTDRILFCEMGSDGMALDTMGNLYLTGKGVSVFDKDGKQLGEIPIDKPWTANVTFAGKDMKTLFITASDAVYSLEMTVPGCR